MLRRKKKPAYSETFYGREANSLFQQSRFEANLSPYLKQHRTIIDRTVEEFESLFPNENDITFKAFHIQNNGKLCLIGAYFETAKVKACFSIFNHQTASIHEQIHAWASTVARLAKVKMGESIKDHDYLSPSLKDHILRLHGGKEDIHFLDHINRPIDQSVLFHTIDVSAGQDIRNQPGISILFGYQFDPTS